MRYVFHNLSFSSRNLTKQWDLTIRWHKLFQFLDNLKKETVNGVRKQSKLLLCDLASKRCKEQDPKDPLFNENHKGERKRLEWCEDVISYYRTLI